MSCGFCGRYASGHPAISANWRIIARQRSAEFVNAGSQRLEVVPVFDAGVLDDFLQAFAIESDRIHAKDRVVIKGGELCARSVNQFVYQDL
jgi:hypothetical protein